MQQLVLLFSISTFQLGYILTAELLSPRLPFYIQLHSIAVCTDLLLINAAMRDIL